MKLTAYSGRQFRWTAQGTSTQGCIAALGCASSAFAPRPEIADLLAEYGQVAEHLSWQDFTAGPYKCSLDACDPDVMSITWEPASGDTVWTGRLTTTAESHQPSVAVAAFVDVLRLDGKPIVSMGSDEIEVSARSPWSLEHLRFESTPSN